MASLKKCVEAKCKDCTYDSAAPGSWRAQVEACTVTKCPLWVVRPITLESLNARRKGGATTVTVDMSLIDGLEDEDESEEGTVENAAS